MCVRSQMNGTRSSPQLPSLAVRLAGRKFLIRAPEIPHYNNFLNSRRLKFLKFRLYSD